jgi:hypothetical protein
MKIRSFFIYEEGSLSSYIKNGDCKGRDAFAVKGGAQQKIR